MPWRHSTEAAPRVTSTDLKALAGHGKAGEGLAAVFKQGLCEMPHSGSPERPAQHHPKPRCTPFRTVYCRSLILLARSGTPQPFSRSGSAPRSRGAERSRGCSSRLLRSRGAPSRLCGARLRLRCEHLIHRSPLCLGQPPRVANEHGRRRPLVDQERAANLGNGVHTREHAPEHDVATVCIGSRARGGRAVGGGTHATSHDAAPPPSIRNTHPDAAASPATS